MRRFWIVCAAVLVFAAAVVGLAAIMQNVQPSRPSRAISGTIDVRDPSARYKTDKKCVGFGELRSGAPVSVTDQSGAVVGTSTLSDGRGAVDPQTCIFAFIVGDLPSAEAYTVKVANRAGITRSKAVLQTNNWNLTLSASQ
jgi:hypothetical protein